MRPHPERALLRRAPLIVFALAFAASQLYLARLDSTSTTLVAGVVVLGSLVVLAWYLIFVRQANVLVSETEVVVHDWLGRQTFRADRRLVQFDLMSVRELGAPEEFAVLSTKSTGKGSVAVLMRRLAWGDNALSALSSVLLGRRDDELAFRSVSKRTLAREFPHVHVQNAPAIAVIAILVVLVAVVVARR